MEEKEKTKDRSVPDRSNNYPQERCQLEGLLAIKMIRDGFKKSKWKFKMAFAMKGGGLEGVSSAKYLF